MSLTSKPDLARYRRLATEGGWIVVGQIATVLGALVLVRVLTEYLPPAEYGRLALTLTLGVLVCQVAFTGSMPGIARFYTLADEKGQVGAYFRASRQLFLYSVGIALVLGLFLLASLIAWGRGDITGLTLIAVVFTILGSLNSTLNSIQNAARQRQVVTLHSGLDSWLKIVFVALLLAWLGASAVYVVFGYILSLLVISASQAYFMGRLISGHSTNKDECAYWQHEIWQFSKPFVIFNLFTWAQASSDRWALEMLTSTADVGLYATLLQLGWVPIAMLTGLATTLIGPILFRRSGDAQDSFRNQDTQRLSWRLTQLTLGLTGFGFFFTWLLHPLIFKYLVAAEYEKVSYLLPWMVLAGGLFAASQVLSLKMLSDLKTYAMIWPKVITSLIGILLNFGGAYLSGLTGVVVGMVCFSIVAFFWFAILTWYYSYQVGLRRSILD